MSYREKEKWKSYVLNTRAGVEVAPKAIRHNFYADRIESVRQRGQLTDPLRVVLTSLSGGQGRMCLLVVFLFVLKAWFTWFPMPLLWAFS